MDCPSASEGEENFFKEILRGGIAALPPPIDLGNLFTTADPSEIFPYDKEYLNLL